jgi:hypothetical protein
MKINLLISLLFITHFRCFSQSGCTDPTANNFNPSAIINDGSCTYNTSSLSVSIKGSVSPILTESSGLVFTNGVLWSHNDSGNPNNIFKIDTANGAVLQTVSITNFQLIDWEDITADSNYIYVSETGNNNGTRTDLKILKIDKSQFLTNTLTAVSATAQSINFSYSDQVSFASSSSHNFDCESLISIGNFLYIFTKDRGDLQTRVYKLSKTPGTYTVSPYSSFNVNGLITGADYNKQTNEVALIGYMSPHKNSFLYILNNFTGDMFFSGNKRRIEIGNSANDWQTEGITYISANELFLSCETSYVPATLYRTFKSSMIIVATGIKERKLNGEGLKIYPNPTSGYFEIESNQAIIELNVMSLDGNIIFSDKSGNKKVTLKTEIISAENGCYILKVRTEDRTYFQKLLLTKQ